MKNPHAQGQLVSLPREQCRRGDCWALVGLRGGCLYNVPVSGHGRKNRCRRRCRLFFRREFTVALVAGVLLFGPRPLGAHPTGSLTVFAAASLTDALTILTPLLEEQNPSLRVMLNFDGSQRLALQIEHGAKADVFASADERWMARVQAHGLITGTPQAFACNELVVIMPRTNPGQIKRLEDLARSGVQVAIAADAVPVGRYTRDVLVKLQEAPRFGGDYAARVLRNVVSEEDQVRAVVGKVELGEVDAGIVYRSDASGAAAENLQMLRIPPAYNIVATYPVAALRDSGNPEAARRFIEVLLSEAGQRVLRAQHFLPVDGGGAAAR